MLGILYFFTNKALAQPYQTGYQYSDGRFAATGSSGGGVSGYYDEGGISGFGGGGVSGFGGGAGQDLPNPFGIYTIPDLIDRIINALIIVAIPLVAVMVMWGAFVIITSAGDPKKAKKGGMIILWAAVGFAILLLANGVTSIIESILWGY